MTTEKIIVGLDLSENAEDALHWYLSHAHREGMEIVLVHCIELLAWAGEDPSLDLYKQMYIETKIQRKRIERKYAQFLKDKKIHGKIMSLYGTNPGKLIVDIANKEQATYIVIGSRGLGRYKRTVLGSVSDYVTHHARCPVIVIKK